MKHLSSIQIQQLKSFKRQLLVSCFIILLGCFAFTAYAGNGKSFTNVSISGTHKFAGYPGDPNAVDGNPAYDNDGLVNGILTVNGDLHMLAGGKITGPGSGATPGTINLQITGKLVMDAGSSIDGSVSGLGGNHQGVTIIINAGSDITLSGGAPGATILSNGETFGCGNGGNITITSGGDILTFDGSQILTVGCSGGAIVITANGSQSKIDIDGIVTSQGTITGVPNQPPGGGPVTVIAKCNLTVSGTGKVSSIGRDPGADLVHLEACAVEIYGLVQSTGAGHVVPSQPHNHLDFTNRPDKDCHSTAGVEVWANSIVLDNLSPGHFGEINANLSVGASGRSWIDLLARGDIHVTAKTSGNYIIHADNGGSGSKGGYITVKSTEGKITATGGFISANSVGSDTRTGGIVTVQSKLDMNLTSALIRAQGNNSVGASHGGTVSLRSFGTGAPNSGPLTLTGTVITVDKSGTVNEKGCNIIGSSTNTGATTVSVSNDCTGGSPSIACQPQPNPSCPVQACADYVVLPLASCTTSCLPCTGSIKINKNVLTDCPGTADEKDWAFTSNIPGQANFVIHAKFGVAGSIMFSGLAPGTYTVTETLLPDWLPSTSCSGCDSHTFNTITFTISHCDNLEGTFNNSNPACVSGNCQWCNKATALTHVQAQVGSYCAVPDILVDVTLPHNTIQNGSNTDVVDLAEVGSGKPATWSIQAAVNYLNAHGDPSPVASPGKTFIGVVAEQPVPVNPADPTSCGHDCAYPLSGDSPWGSENVIVNNLLTAQLNIVGCSVTMKAANSSLPVFTVQNGVGPVFIMDLHVKGTNAPDVAGYLVKGGGDGNLGLVTLKNSRAINFDYGYEIHDNNVLITGAPEISHGKIGVWIVGGSNVDLETNNSIFNNSQYGIRVAGNNNTINDQDVGEVGHANGVGISVSGTGNLIEQNHVLANTGNGIEVDGGSSASPNVIKKNISGAKNKGNGGHGILVGGTGSGTSNPVEIEENTTQANDLDGIRVTGAGHQLKKNISGGDSDQDNGDCEFTVAAGNFNSTGNKANGVTIAGADGSAFPTTCQGSNVSFMVNPAETGLVPPGTPLLQIFPNPTKGRTTLQFVSAVADGYTMNVIDATGRTVMSEVIQAAPGLNVHEIDLTKMSRGIYMLTLKIGSGNLMKKVVVQ